MRRRDFIAGASASAAWPFAASGQQAQPVRRVGVLMAPAADDPDGQARLAAFQEGMQQLGWVDGRNVRLDIRWAGLISTAFAEMLRSWWRSSRTPSWPAAAR